MKNSLIEIEGKTNKNLEEINKSLKKYLHLNQIAKCLPCNGIELKLCLYFILMTDLPCIVTGWGYLAFFWEDSTFTSPTMLRSFRSRHCEGKIFSVLFFVKV